MAFNPRPTETGKREEPAVLNLKGSKPGRVVSQLERLENEAKLDLKFNKKELLPPPANNAPLGENLEYYIEWWKIGTGHTDIENGTFHSANIRSFIKMFLKTGKYTVVYLRREKDQRVLKDARGTHRHNVNLWSLDRTSETTG